MRNVYACDGDMTRNSETVRQREALDEAGASGAMRETTLDGKCPRYEELILYLG